VLRGSLANVGQAESLAAFKAGEDLDTLSNEFGVPMADVLDVLRVAA